MDKNMTWDLTQMYPDLDAWQADLKKAQDIAEQIAAMQGTITQNAQNLYQALTLNDKLGEIVSALFVYAKMYFDQNMADATAKNIYESADSAYTIIAEKLAFFELIKSDRRKLAGIFLRAAGAEALRLFDQKFFRTQRACF